MIYVTSDTHFNHDKPFLYEPRGFSSVDDMNKTIINNWNGIVTDQDDIYVFYLNINYILKYVKI